MIKINFVLKTIIILSLAAGSFCFFSENTKAGSVDNISGWAWVGNTMAGGNPSIGWLSFNSANCDTDDNGFSNGGGACPPAGTAIADYGVNVDPATGMFFGEAWNNTIGWIDFSPVGPYPEAPNNYACLDMPGPGQLCDGVGPWQVSGWARAVNYGGGWEGWIKLRGSYGAGTYGVSYDNGKKEFEGWAWAGNPSDPIGSGVVGWISFNHINCDTDGDGFSNGAGACPPAGTAIADYQVISDLTPPPPPPILPIVSNLGVSSGWNPCVGSAALHPTLKWDLDKNPDGYRIKIFKGANLIYEYQIEGIASTEHIPNFGANTFADGVCSAVGSNGFHNNPRCNLTFNQGYNWQVQAKDTAGNWSNWSAIATLDTPPHGYPSPSFTFDNRIYATAETVDFTDTSVCYDMAGSTPCVPDANVSYAWDFDYKGIFNPTSAVKGDNSTSYLATGKYTVMLRLTDSSLATWPLNGICDYIPPAKVRVGIPLPEWKEIPPFSKIDLLKLAIAWMTQKFFG